MPTALDCAILSEDVYNEAPGPLVASNGWNRVNSRTMGSGFAAATYLRGAEVLVAFRGTETDDRQDIIADAHMVPAAQTESAMQYISNLPVPPRYVTGHSLGGQYE